MLPASEVHIGVDALCFAVSECEWCSALELDKYNFEYGFDTGFTTLDTRLCVYFKHVSLSELG